MAYSKVKASDLKVGEIYDYGGRRARVDRIGFDKDNVAEVTVSMGRNFENQRVLKASMWRKEHIPYLSETWEASKERRRREKNFRDQARELSDRLQDVSSELGVSGVHISSSGRLSVYGSLESLTQVVNALEQYASSPTDSALSCLLS